MYGDAESFLGRALALGPEPDRGVLRARPRTLVRREPGWRASGVARRCSRGQVQSMGIEVRGHAGGSGRRGRALALSLFSRSRRRATAGAQLPLGLQRLDEGRFTVAAAPHDAPLARSLLAAAVRGDTFPWLPRPSAPVLIVIAPDRRRFVELIGPHAPEYGAAIAMPVRAANRYAGKPRRLGCRRSRCRCSGTSSRTWPCTRRWVTCRRAGSTRAMRRWRRGSGAGSR